MNKSFYKKMQEKSVDIGINLSEDNVYKFEKYKNLLLEWNDKINLTSIIEEDEIILKHFIDSMTVLKYIDENESVIDVGTGAGFPGIPISIIKNNNKITLLDSLNKRIKFLDEVKEELELKNVNTVHLRAEDGGQESKYREKYDISTSRAVALLNVLVEYLMPFVKIGGRCICMKGTDCREEIEEARNAIKELGGKIEKVDEFTLPNSDFKRTIIIIKKIKNTPEKYPRRSGIPLKKPIR